MARVFISYATRDTRAATEVLRWLRSRHHDTFLASDLRDGVRVGEDWKRRLYHELRRVDAVACFVTKAFVRSNWCAAEVGIADALGCELLPIHAEPLPPHPLMERVQFVDLFADREEALAKIDEALRRLDRRGRASWRDGDNPYPGLEPFDERFHSLFFGRDHEVRDLLGRLRTLAGSGMTAVLGPSGSGKSSLLRAGLLPALSEDWVVLPPFRPGDDPVRELARTLAAGAASRFPTWSTAAVLERLDAPGGLADIVGDLTVAQPPQSERRVLVSVDQAEELFAPTMRAQRRERFAALLRPAVGARLAIVLTLRSEFLDDLVDIPAFRDLDIGSLVLAPLGREMMRAAIEEPASIAGLKISAQLVARLVDDTGGGEALPLLAYTLRDLAEGLGRGQRMDEERYDRLGGVARALARQADAARTASAKASGMTEDEVVAALVPLAMLDDSGRVVRRWVRYDGLSEPMRAVADVFVGKRLLTDTQGPRGQRLVGVAHEKLFVEWPPLAAAISDHARALHAVAAVERAAQDWGEHDRAAAYLWDGERLATTRAVLGPPWSDPGGPPRAPSAGGVHLGQPAVDFLAANWDRAERDRLERERAQREREQARLRTRRFRRVAFVAVAVLAAVTTVLAVVGAVQTRAANTQREAAEQQRGVATARGLLARAEELRSRLAAESLRSGIAAFQADPGSQTRASLVTTLLGNNYAGTLDGEPAGAVAFSPVDPDLMAVASGHTVVLWDVADAARPRKLSATDLFDGSGLVSLAFHPGGRLLAAGGWWGAGAMIDISDAGHPRVLVEKPFHGESQVFGMAFAPGGRTAASGGWDGRVVLWDVTDPAAPASTAVIGQPGGQPVSGVAFSPDGRTLVVCDEQAPTVWDVTDISNPVRLATLSGHAGRVGTLAFSPEGAVVATGSSDTTSILWDLRDPGRPRRLATLSGHATSVSAVAFGRGGDILVTAGWDTTAIVWDITDPELPFRVDTLAGHSGAVNGVAVDPAGERVATASRDGTTVLWDLDDPRPAQVGEFPGQAGGSRMVRLSRDGKIALVTEGQAGTAEMWDVADRRAPRHLATLPHAEATGAVDIAVGSVDLSADGSIAITGGTDGVAVLWDIGNRAQPRVAGFLAGHSEVWGVALSADGRTAVTGSNPDTMAVVWDVADPAQPRQLAVAAVPGHWVNWVALSPDGRLLATAGGDPKIVLWDIGDRSRPTVLGTIDSHPGPLYRVAFDLSGTRLATASDDGTTKLFDVSDPAQPVELGMLAEHASSVFTAAFHPAAPIVATAGWDQTVILWDVTDPAEPNRLATLAGHRRGVGMVAFTPDGATIVTTSDDGTSQLWDVRELADVVVDPTGRACRILGLPAGGPECTGD